MSDGSATPIGAKPGGGRIVQLDTMRGIAVALVFLHHAFQGFYNREAGLPALAEAVDFGRAGIVVFFLISGFVIVRAIPERTVQAAGVFWKRRFWRLFPAFWAAVILAAVLSLWGVPKTSILALPVTPGSFLANLTMLPHLFDQPLAIGVFWTLEVELIFYALISLAILARPMTLPRYLTYAFALFAASIGYAGVMGAMGRGGNLSNDLVYLNLLNLSIMFAGACLRLHWDARRGLSERFVATMPAGLKLYFAVFIAFLAVYTLLKARGGIDIHSVRALASYTLGFAIFLLGIERLPYSAAGKYIGDRSYSFYLLHMPVMAVLTALVSRFEGLTLPFWGYAMLAFTMCLLLSSLMFHFVERPANRRGHRSRARPVASWSKANA
jgi:peptidoglycan/LPS O-acetylase OafA/YrhL